MGSEFPNGLLAIKLLNDAIARQTERVWAKETMSWEGLSTLCEDDFFVEHKALADQENALKKLENIVGLSEVKSFIQSLHAQLTVEMQRRLQGINCQSSSQNLHMIFTGSPGTGKTTVARVIAELLRSLGLLRKGHLIEADRSTLVAGYSGQTALKTKAVVESALGGVLFIDEAYALVQGDGRDSFGHEALDTLIKMTEDHRGNLVVRVFLSHLFVLRENRCIQCSNRKAIDFSIRLLFQVILAGYQKQMRRLLDTNPGLTSRFPNKLHFADYTAEEMFEIAETMLESENLVLKDKHARAALENRIHVLLTQGEAERDWSKSMVLEKPGISHGNGRSIRNILEEAKRRMAVRLQTCAKPSGKDLVTLVAEDF